MALFLCTFSQVCLGHFLEFPYWMSVLDERSLYYQVVFWLWGFHLINTAPLLMLLVPPAVFAVWTSPRHSWRPWYRAKVQTLVWIIPFPRLSFSTVDKVSFEHFFLLSVYLHCSGYATPTKNITILQNVCTNFSPHCTQVWWVFAQHEMVV